MRVSILKYVLFSIVICSFEYVKKELYLVNDREIYLERNIIYFRNDRILSDADNQFDLNEFYESTLSLANQFNDCNDGNKEIAYLRNIIDSHIKKHKETNTLLNLKNVDSKIKKLINKSRKELEKLAKELDNKMNGELAIQPIHDKRIIKKDENSSVSEHEDFKQLENDEYNEITSSSNCKKLKISRNLKKKAIKCIVVCLALIVIFLAVIPGPLYLMVLYILFL
ncbi:hypothetical protein YYC_05595 [Plasmodium yoelii 17X]|uniref:Fam-b protein n=4 Tax=Plasmodium yoelii TaxID=5861 RepID=A0AAE9X2N2_PLAYO|nr:fam-b protein [Plasmodium yoelii]EAA17479.1 hypothetical protein [Plasmodium yoelii yoelii]ETB56450.1 hypothetical protein YYC_05595 [Plasmodium yoelii 17X]WBY60497.1 fam-b protein [Plasmodium yoelii yoelii]VTZ81104.1 fam-b protein [Plasmodium yoelii]|eukprot:XP_725914.1 fam-b protein [Plasmodium yoelii]